MKGKKGMSKDGDDNDRKRHPGPGFLSEKDYKLLRSVQTDEAYPFPGFVSLEYREGDRSGKFRIALVDSRNREILDCEWFPFLLFPSQAVHDFKRSLKEAGVW